MITTIVLLLLLLLMMILMMLRRLLLLYSLIYFHVFILFIYRHQFYVTIKATVLLGRIMLLLRHNDLQLLVVLVRIDKGWRIARHEHNVLSLRRKSLSGWTC